MSKLEQLALERLAQAQGHMHAKGLAKEAVDAFIVSITPFVLSRKVLLTDETATRTNSKKQLIDLLKKIEKAISLQSTAEEFIALISERSVGRCTATLLAGFSGLRALSHEDDFPGDNKELITLSKELAKKAEAFDKQISLIQRDLRNIDDAFIKDQLAVTSLPYEAGEPRISLHTLQVGVQEVLDLFPETKSGDFIGPLMAFWKNQSALDDPMFPDHVRANSLPKINKSRQHPFWAVAAILLDCEPDALIQRFRYSSLFGRK